MVGCGRRAFWATVFLSMAFAWPGLGQDAASRAREEARREEWQKVGDIFQAMGVRPGAVVADVGAGGGFFTARLSRAVGAQGRVYAVDVDADVVKRLLARVASDEFSNVHVVHGTFDDPKLPAGTLDAALIVNTYHEMKEHRTMLAKLRAALKPEGRLVIVEPISPSRRDRPRAQQTDSHEIGAEHVQQDAREAGFRIVRLEDPFTTRRSGRDEEWLLVLKPAPAVTLSPAEPLAETESADWKAPELRIAVEEFKRLLAANAVLVLDVRDPESYRDGHIPGAMLMTLEELAAGSAARLAGERRPIVTYCS